MQSGGWGSHYSCMDERDDPGTYEQMLFFSGLTSSRGTAPSELPIGRTCGGLPLYTWSSPEKNQCFGGAGCARIPLLSDFSSEKEQKNDNQHAIITHLSDYHPRRKEEEDKIKSHVSYPRRSQQGRSLCRRRLPGT